MIYSDENCFLGMAADARDQGFKRILIPKFDAPKEG
jgi:hypothetical protein